ncbi:BgTH12-03854 [Blumeria graminis f. sp. triticale]|uniref:Bgt-2358 n=3 Tax=Blumeria graminis TaxID=34373 RepID=A0A381L5Y1_BLUGR|nr:hypothetical protein BGT96224_2358 [Blumeria graminis f. sp. tritici 96224]CAD6499746.1 BgTH12-03854 [Blumeria graminis f. sp. triticale]VCU39918.1 Bgt-2358 [Blumeria graminis f. sp. tritici]
MDVESATQRPGSVSGNPDTKNTISCDPITQDYKNYSESCLNSGQSQPIEFQATGSRDEEVSREVTASCIESESLNVESEPTGLHDHPANKPTDDEVIISPAGLIPDLPFESIFEIHNIDIQNQSLEDDEWKGAHKAQKDFFPSGAIGAPPTMPTESLGAINYSPRKDLPSSQDNKALFRAFAQQNSNLGQIDQPEHLTRSIAANIHASNLQTPIVGELTEPKDTVSSPRQEITQNNDIIITEIHSSEDMKNPSTPVRSHVGKATHIVTSRIGTEAQIKPTNPDYLTPNAPETSSESQRLRKRPIFDNVDSESRELRRSSTPGHNTQEAAPKLPEHHPSDVNETDNHGSGSMACAGTTPSELTRTITHNISNSAVRQPSPATSKGDDERGSLAVAPQASPRTPSIPNKEVLAAELKAMRIASITARNTALAAEVDRTRMILASRTQELRAPAADTVRMHIELLHAYNEIRDVGQGLIGMLAEQQGVRIGSLYENFGVGIKD